MSFHSDSLAAICLPLVSFHSDSLLAAEMLTDMLPFGEFLFGQLIISLGQINYDSVLLQSLLRLRPWFKSYILCMIVTERVNPRFSHFLVCLPYRISFVKMSSKLSVLHVVDVYVGSRVVNIATAVCFVFL